MVGTCDLHSSSIHRPSGYCFPFIVGYSHMKGHQLLAVRDIHAGEVVLTDSPASVGPLPGACLQCGADLPSPPHHCEHCGLPLCGQDCEQGDSQREECQQVRGGGQDWEGVDVFAAVGVMRMLQSIRDDKELGEKVMRL